MASSNGRSLETIQDMIVKPWGEHMLNSMGKEMPLLSFDSPIPLLGWHLGNSTIRQVVIGDSNPDSYYRHGYIGRYFPLRIDIEVLGVTNYLKQEVRVLGELFTATSVQTPNRSQVYSAFDRTSYYSQPAIPTAVISYVNPAVDVARIRRLARWQTLNAEWDVRHATHEIWTPDETSAVDELIKRMLVVSVLRIGGFESDS